MLDLAVKAGLPIVTAMVKDTLNAKELLKFYLPDAAVVTDVKNLLSHPGAMVGIMLKSPAAMNTHVAYSMLLDAGKTLVVVNHEVDPAHSFDVGELPVPKAMILSELAEGGFEGRKATKLLSSLGNLTLKEVGEVLKLTQAQYGELTPQAVNTMRRELFDESQGLLQVDTHLDFYFPDPRITNTIETERWFFMECEDTRLIPRGLMLHGPAGTGKSQAAKYFANEWGVPLYLMDLSSMMGKYVGQSEKGMMSMLRRIDKEAPAILLIDEVEKLFKSDGDSGTTTRMLSQLLWWLAEHRSRVFTIMTSNNLKALPEELYRPGRIDQITKLNGLNKVEAETFVNQVMAQFEGEFTTPDLGVVFADNIVKKGTTVSHAVLVKAVKDSIKSQLIKGE